MQGGVTLGGMGCFLVAAGPAARKALSAGLMGHHPHGGGGVVSEVAPALLYSEGGGSLCRPEWANTCMFGGGGGGGGSVRWHPHCCTLRMTS
jgi:hypothetical protein